MRWLETTMRSKIFYRIFAFDKRNETASREARYDLTERKPYALDNIRYLACALAAWIGQLLHIGRIHSYPARYCDCDPDYQFNPGSASVVNSHQ
jgi:hypothetical protein